MIMLPAFFPGWFQGRDKLAITSPLQLANSLNEMYFFIHNLSVSNGYLLTLSRRTTT